MSAFGKDWVQRFKSTRTSEEAKVRSSYHDQPLLQKNRRQQKAQAHRAPVFSQEVVNQWPLLLKLKEVAEILRFRNTESVTRLIHEGLLSARKVGREWRIPRGALVSYLAQTESSHVA